MSASGRLGELINACLGQAGVDCSGLQLMFPCSIRVPDMLTVASCRKNLCLLQGAGWQIDQSQLPAEIISWCAEIMGAGWH